jgi:hypothetical protein
MRTYGDFHGKHLGGAVPASDLARQQCRHGTGVGGRATSAARLRTAFAIVTPLCGVTQILGAPRLRPGRQSARSAGPLRDTAERCHEIKTPFRARGNECTVPRIRPAVSPARFPRGFARKPWSAHGFSPSRPVSPCPQVSPRLLPLPGFPRRPRSVPGFRSGFRADRSVRAWLPGWNNDQGRTRLYYTHYR